MSVVLSLILLGFSWLIAITHFRDTVDSPELFFRHLVVSVILVNSLGLTLIAHGVWAARRVQAHHEKIIKACRCLAEGLYQERLDLKEYPEMRELEESFNGMAETIAQRLERIAPGGAA